MHLSGLEERIRYIFKDKNLLITALTHPSYGSDRHAPNYQRLEFLGDAVLQLAVSRYLYEHSPEPEGRLSRARARLVCESALAAAARGYGLGAFVILSPGEEKTGGRDRDSILSDVMEAVFAAVYLDGGWEEAESLVLRTLDRPLHEHRSGQSLDYDYKSLLQILTQKIDGSIPVYELIEQRGEPHQPTFVMQATLHGQPIGRGEGHSKQAAQQIAAQDAYDRLKGSANG
ncbi:MAG: ribonuclease III [Clostridia bacterium]|nr:ribonuclease III [Clostridia bacterium]